MVEKDQLAFADLLYRLSDKTYEMEMKRGEELNELSAQLLTCITIMSVALLTPVSFLFECFSDGTGNLSDGQICLAWMYAIVLIPESVALLLVLSARTLRTMAALAAPVYQAEYVVEECKTYPDNREESISAALFAAVKYANGLNNNFNGMSEKHDRSWKRLKLSMVLMGVSCGAALLFGLMILGRII